jgi:hypothetical protein
MALNPMTVRAEMLRLGLKQTQIAKAVKMHPVSVSLALHGNRDRTQRLLKRIWVYVKSKRDMGLAKSLAKAPKGA